MMCVVGVRAQRDRHAQSPSKDGNQGIAMRRSSSETKLGAAARALVSYAWREGDNVVIDHGGHMAYAENTGILAQRSNDRRVLSVQSLAHCT